MKYLLLIPILTILFTSNMVTQYDNEVERKDFDGITYEERIEKWNSLSNSNKYSLWVDKLEQVLNSDVSITQKTVISELLDVLKKEHFNDKTNIKDYSSLNSVIEKISTEFSNEEGVKIFVTLADYSRLATLPFSEPSKCECNTESVFGCGHPATDCNSSGAYNLKCTERKKGCGFLWQYQCDGFCL